MRWLWALLAVSPLAQAQHTLYTCALIANEYVVGAKTPASGLYRRTASGEWKRAGYNHPFLTGLTFDPANPSTLYVAGGNGLIRATAQGEKWTILTGEDVTEIRDVAITGRDASLIHIAHSAGIRESRDAGKTWREIGEGRPRRYAECLGVDAKRPGTILAGGEDGIFRTENGGATWQRAGAAGFSVLRIEHSPHDECFWLAGTQGGGLFASTDCGRTFENSGTLNPRNNIYDIAFDPTNPRRIALATWGTGVLVSTDAGKTWQARNNGLPRTDAVTLAFDPDHAGRLYVSIHLGAIHVSDNAGLVWRRDGLDNSHSTRMRFSPEVRR